MSSPVGASGDASAVFVMEIKPVPKMQQVRDQSMIASAKLAEQLTTQAAAPPQNGHGQIVDTFA